MLVDISEDVREGVLERILVHALEGALVDV